MIWKKLSKGVAISSGVIPVVRINHTILKNFYHRIGELEFAAPRVERFPNCSLILANCFVANSFIEFAGYANQLF